MARILFVVIQFYGLLTEATWFRLVLYKCKRCLSEHSILYGLINK